MKKQRTLLVIFLLAALAIAVTLVLAQAGGYELDWYSVDGGGGRLAAGGYNVESAIGQPDAGRLSAGAYQLQGGLLLPGAAPDFAPDLLYLPFVRK